MYCIIQNYNYTCMCMAAHPMPIIGIIIYLILEFCLLIK